MKCIKIKGKWCNLKYVPNSKRDTGIKFLKALRRVQKHIAKEKGTKFCGLKVEIVHQKG